MPYATREGLRLHYERTGDGEPPLLFVHGWCCDHTFFQPQVDHFRSKHDVITFDLRGCGASDRPDDGYDLPTLADDVAWLCNELRVRRPVVIGHSLGGMIGIELSARYPSVPGAIVAVDPGPITALPESITTLQTFAANLLGPEGDAVRRAYIRGMFEPSDEAERSASILETMCSVPLPIAAAVIRGAAEWNGTGALAVASAPVLVIVSRVGGSNDPARLLAVKPSVQIGVTVASGHFNQFDAADQVNAMIEKFLLTTVA